MPEGSTPSIRRIMLFYLGRRGAIPLFTHDLLRAAARVPEVMVSACVSAHNELLADINALDGDTLVLPTFSGGFGAATNLWRAPALRAALGRHISRFQPEVVVELMPHVWSPLFEPVFAAARVPRMCLVHDVVPHSGDITAMAQEWLLSSALRAQRVLTLSGFARTQLLRSGRVKGDRLVTLFHPDFAMANAPFPQRREKGLSVMFLGRVLPYKGLDLLVGAVEHVRALGVEIQLGVFGEGPLGALESRLRRLGAEVRNQWLSQAEIADGLGRYEVVAAPHREITQSGVVAHAFGAGRPVIATPVGALPEQVENGVTGLIAAQCTAESLAACIVRFATDEGLLQRCAEAVRVGAAGRSMEVFLARLAQEGSISSLGAQRSDDRLGDGRFVEAVHAQEIASGGRDQRTRR
ncbi:MAG TPA: hypothetical protein DHW63_02720 [Hyphomonadaceae bacterium]|nr:hypothetical protein [Hyphomonadaceae bacterium]